MNIVENAKVYKRGDVFLLAIDPIKDFNNDLEIKVEVINSWYPKQGEQFTETKEMQHLGYLQSCALKKFPQLTVKALDYSKTWEKNFVVTGEDFEKNLIRDL